jgi:lysophospholipase L1-like esterase
MSRPDIVLWHIGTNDVRGLIPLERTLGGYSVALAAIRRRNPDVVVILAKIIPVTERNSREIAIAVENLNAAIPGWAARNTTPRSPIHVVDMYNGFNAAWIPDGVHPDATEGSSFMADRWYGALEKVMQTR